VPHNLALLRFAHLLCSKDSDCWQALCLLCMHELQVYARSGPASHRCAEGTWITLCCSVSSRPRVRAEYNLRFPACFVPSPSQVAARLWQLLVVRAGLMQHLGAVKHYLLLARGDFWDVFLEEAGRLMAAPPRPATANADVAVPFQAAAGKTSAAEDPYYRLFKIHFSDQPLKVCVVGGGGVPVVAGGQGSVCGHLGDVCCLLPPAADPCASSRTRPLPVNSAHTVPPPTSTHPHPPVRC
jgi:hypothetical protein